FTMILKGLPLYALVSMVGKPRGYGSLHFPDADPKSLPVIESRMFSDSQDRYLARESLKRCGELLATKALSSLGRSTLWPGAYRNDDLLEGALSYFCDSGYHPCGTVPMGPAPGETAAVDGRGRVFGLDGLYVVDASL